MPHERGASLPDVNVLVALTWPTHIHHDVARQWFERKARVGWATCPITQLGFVRISSNPKIIKDAVSPGEALAVLERLLALPGHQFWPADIALTSAGAFASLAMVGHRQVTDAYLLALTQQQEGRLVTLDRSIVDLIADRAQRTKWVEFIE